MNCAGQVKIVGDKLHKFVFRLLAGQVQFSGLFLTLLLIYIFRLLSVIGSLTCTGSDSLHRGHLVEITSRQERYHT